MVEVAGGYQIVTRPELHEWVRRLFHERTTQKLSVASLETLAVIAYKQPVTAPEIAEIRGVNTSGVLGTLVERQLVKVVGRKQVVGRPFLYGTTREFLERFGLNDLSDLPKVEDMSELLGFDLPATIGEPDAADRAAVRQQGRGRSGAFECRIPGSTNSCPCTASRPAAPPTSSDCAGPGRAERQDGHRARNEGGSGPGRDSASTAAA